jgi:hypothetical protein
MRRRARWMFFVTVFLLATGRVRAAQEASPGVVKGFVPRIVQFNGTLKDNFGNPLRGVQGVTFTLYSEPEGGAPLWIETQNVTADELGRFAVLLGAATREGIPIEVLASGESHWLGFQTSTSDRAEQSRVLLVSVPYALKAADAETLGGKPLSAFMLAPETTAADAPTAENWRRLQPCPLHLYPAAAPPVSWPDGSTTPGHLAIPSSRKAAVRSASERQHQTVRCTSREATRKPALN